MKKDLTKKLIVWDGIGESREDKKIYAKDYYCVKCYRDKKEVPAEVFWPHMDPDIPFNPYCQNCMNKIQIELWMNNQI